MPDSDDEPITLSAHALDALREFYSDRDARAEQFEQLKSETEDRAVSGGIPAKESALKYPLTMEAFGEDWNKSQFWYSDDTADLFAKQLLNGATADKKIAVVSAPSAFVALKNILASYPSDAPKPTLTLLEHDDRFTVFPEFVFYDFMNPVKLPAHLKGSMDCIICDPPFLSEDCQTKAALTVRWMSKSNESKLIVCTGERMETMVTKLYRSFGLKTTDFEPMHARGLSNEFLCYANFENEQWKWGPENGRR